MDANLVVKLSVLYATLLATQVALDDSSRTEQRNVEVGDAGNSRLLFRDCTSYPAIDNAADHIRWLIVETLELPHLEWRILQAAHTDKGLLFEMSSPTEAKEVLERFADRLRQKDCVLKTTQKEFISPES